MELRDFDYHLPARLIATRPLEQRDSSRLMVVNRSVGAIEHRVFRDIPGYLRPGDLLVLNDTSVIPARLRCERPTGGSCEALFVGMAGEGAPSAFRCLLKPAARLRPGSVLIFGGRDGNNGRERGVVRGKGPDGLFVVELDGLDAEELLRRHGSVPLPPYIRSVREAEPEDSARYQTVYARHRGAVAAPTAGLHFTPSLLEEIRRFGVEVATITLHTGLGTFMPVRSDDMSAHRPLAEPYLIGEKAFEAIVRAKDEGRRVVAVGTTTTRALEASAADGFDRPALSGSTGLFIRPRFAFRVVDALITNFHLPRSTLIMLASAFSGHGLLMAAYGEAVERGYRFYSYGDAMLIV
jgi:S-adenosylmethionine:tRNA ribosyltransferase-isomerase